jgi:phytoene desaturase
MSGKKVVVVGAGFGGLSAAALLARDGFDVTVLEKNDRPGGRAMVYEQDGFKFDMGPSWYMMLEAFDRFFAEFGKTTDDFYETVRLDPSYRVFFDRDDVVDVAADLDENLALFDSIEPGGAEKLKHYLEKSKQQYDIAVDHLLYRDYDSLLQMLDREIIIKGVQLNIYKALDAYARGFFSEEKALKLIEYSIAFVGGGPYISPAVYSMLAHADLNLGQWYPMGGMGKIAASVYHLAQEQGAEFLFNQPVTDIMVDGHRAKSVVTKSDSFETDIVLATADYPHVEMELLDRGHQSYSNTYWQKRVLAPAGFRIFIGLDKKLDALTHHMLYLNEDWDMYFDEVYGKSPRWPTDPSYYVCCPSKTDPSVAPPGGETFSILVLVAPGLEDTPEIRDRYYDKIMTHFEQLIGESVRDAVAVKKIFAINDFRETYNAYKGTALGIAHTLRQTAALRPRHQSKKVHNLYYAGHYTHPGIGVPVTIISAQLASEKIVNNHG